MIHSVYQLVFLDKLSTQHCVINQCPTPWTELDLAKLTQTEIT